jgi:fermentation-respiration switch protein FrsA (DUF1100 family)
MVGALLIGEKSLVYQSFPGPTDPAMAGVPGYTRHTLSNGDKPTIVYWENQPPAPKATVLYFHGNGGGLHAHMPALKAFDALGLHVVAAEYPGYPGAPGEPSEAALVGNAVTLYDHVARTHPDLTIWGYSLGSGVASQLAAQRHPRSLVLEAPFTAVVDRAGELFPFIPVKPLMKNQYRSRDVIAQVKAPLLILHGDADHIVPISHGRALYALAAEPKHFKQYEDAGHLDLMDYRAYEDALAFILRNR